MTVWLILQFFGELLLSLSFTVGFFKTFCFLSLLVGFLGGKEGHNSRHPYVLVGLRRPNIRRKILWLFTLNLKATSYNGNSHETLDKLHVKYVLLKGAVVIFVQNKLDSSVMCSGKLIKSGLKLG